MDAPERGPTPPRTADRNVMKAVTIGEYGDPEVLTVEERPEPNCGPGDVLVDVRATALNRADVLQRQGNYPPPESGPEDIPGLEFAGLVVQTGDRVRSVERGESVFGLLSGGGYAEKVSTPGSLVMPVPDNLSFPEATAIPEVFFTAYDGLFDQCDLGLGDRLLIHAAGSGVGTAAIQLAREAGVETIFGTASGPKLERARELGLNHGINYREQSFREVILDATGGTGVDVILDLVGSQYFEDNLACLDTLGRLLLVGDLNGHQSTIDLVRMKKQRLRIFGTALRTRALHEKAALTERFERRVLPLFEQERIHPVIDRVFSYREASDAHRYMEANRNFGKIVLSFEEAG